MRGMRWAGLVKATEENLKISQRPACISTGALASQTWRAGTGESVFAEYGGDEDDESVHTRNGAATKGSGF